ncbi:MAG: hypothetical protein QY332_13520 [Anaerolineales bacterium]|nr:MAG: hypothetical protein QY332_13520 [Anaerolineales bacterium]
MSKGIKSRKQGRGCLYVVLAGLLVICSLGAVPVLGICPPEGPWPQPPWCVSKVDCVDYPPTVIDDIIRRTTDQVGAQNLQVANGCMFMRSFGDNEFQPFVYQELDYLPGTDEYPPIERDIAFVVFPADYWGNNYIIPQGLYEGIPQFARDLWYDTVTLGTDPRKHNNLENTAKRSAQMGAQQFMVSDFIMLVDDDLTLERFDYPGVESLTQAEMKRIARVAHENGQEAVLMLALLDTAFYDKVADYFNSGEYGSLYDVEVEIQRYNTFDVGEATADLHASWRAAILEEARMAEAAGFDRLLVTPGTIWMNSGEMVALDDAEWLETIAQVRQVFSGKLGGGRFDMTADYEGYTFMHELDFVIIDIGIEQVMAGVTSGQLDEMTERWKTYVLSPNVMVFAGVPEVLHSPIVSSYDGVLENGWIEPGGRYPDLVRDDRVQAAVLETLMRALYETPDTPVNGVIAWGYGWHDFIYPNQHEIRDDLSTSIRGKDAENVFYRWTTLFK